MNLELNRYRVRWRLSVFLLLVFAAGCSHKPTREIASVPIKEVAGFFNNSGDELTERPHGNIGGGGGQKPARTAPVYPIIDIARKTLDIEIYEMTDYGFRRAIRSALERGVKVRVIKDPTPVGEKCPLFLPVRNEKKTVIGYERTKVDAITIVVAKQNGKQRIKQNAPDEDCMDQRRLGQEIIDKGGAFVPFNKPELCAKGGTGCYEHGKMVISDGVRALLSTGNFNSSNLCNLEVNPITGKGPGKCNRDYSYVLNAHISPSDAQQIRILQAVFDRDFEQKRHDVVEILHASGAEAGRVTVSPYSTQPLVDFIRSAVKTVWIENQYMKEPGINAAILEAAKKGVQVNLVLSSLCSFGKPRDSARDKAIQLFSAFDEAGVRTSFFTSRNVINGKPGYMHAKAIVVDGKRAWIGSVNGSEMSTSNNREYGVFFEDHKQVANLLSFIEKDFSSYANETWKESLDCIKDGTALDSEGDDSV